MICGLINSLTIWILLDLSYFLIIIILTEYWILININLKIEKFKLTETNYLKIILIHSSSIFFSHIINVLITSLYLKKPIIMNLSLNNIFAIIIVYILCFIVTILNLGFKYLKLKDET